MSLVPAKRPVDDTYDDEVESFQRAVQEAALRRMLGPSNRVVPVHQPREAFVVVVSEPASNDVAPQADTTPSSDDIDKQLSDTVEHVLAHSNPFEQLRLPLEAIGIPELKKVYRTFALLVHPDKNPHPRAKYAFSAIVNAFAILQVPSKQAAILARFRLEEQEKSAAPCANQGPVCNICSGSHYTFHCLLPPGTHVTEAKRSTKCPVCHLTFHAPYEMDGTATMNQPPYDRICPVHELGWMHIVCARNLLSQDALHRQLSLAERIEAQLVGTPPSIASTVRKIHSAFDNGVLMVLVEAGPGSGKSWTLTCFVKAYGVWEQLTLSFNLNSVENLSRAGVTNAHSFNSLGNRALTLGWAIDSKRYVKSGMYPTKFLEHVSVSLVDQKYMCLFKIMYPKGPDDGNFPHSLEYALFAESVKNLYDTALQTGCFLPRADRTQVGDHLKLLKLATEFGIDQELEDTYSLLPAPLKARAEVLWPNPGLRATWLVSCMAEMHVAALRTLSFPDWFPVSRSNVALVERVHFVTVPKGNRVIEVRLPIMSYTEQISGPIHKNVPAVVTRALSGLNIDEYQDVSMSKVDMIERILWDSDKLRANLGMPPTPLTCFGDMNQSMNRHARALENAQEVLLTLRNNTCVIGMPLTLRLSSAITTYINQMIVAYWLEDVEARGPYPKEMLVCPTGAPEGEVLWNVTFEGGLTPRPFDMTVKNGVLGRRWADIYTLFPLLVKHGVPCMLVNNDAHFTPCTLLRTMLKFIREKYVPNSIQDVLELLHVAATDKDWSTDIEKYGLTAGVLTAALFLLAKELNLEAPVGVLDILVLEKYSDENCEHVELKSGHGSKGDTYHSTYLPCPQHFPLAQNMKVVNVTKFQEINVCYVVSSRSTHYLYHMTKCEADEFETTYWVNDAPAAAFTQPADSEAGPSNDKEAAEHDEDEEGFVATQGTAILE